MELRWQAVLTNELLKAVGNLICNYHLASHHLGNCTDAVRTAYGNGWQAVLVVCGVVWAYKEMYGKPEKDTTA